VNTREDAKQAHHASLNVEHHKNEGIKGKQEIPLSSHLLLPITLLERASHFLFPNSPTLFFGYGGEVYELAYFSSIVKGAISLPNMSLNANDLRHMFVTLWMDFINTPSTNMLNLSISHLNASATSMMLNSTNAWDASYDDSHMDRAMLTTLAMWPKFVEFVKEAHLDKEATKEWDPLTIPLSSLPSSS